MDGSERRTGVIHEIEALARRARVLVLVIPVLLVGGLGAGRLLSHSLSIPAGTEVRQATAVPIPRQRLFALANRMEQARTAGDRTAEYIRTYQTEVAPVEHVLRGRGVPASIARRVAWPLVEQSYRNGVEPATVLSVLLLESGGRPQATSSVGARGLMQVMPAWSGFWRGCSRDLYDIEGNLCNGTSILAWYMDRFGGDERRALLGYNGCVTGSITPNCRQYPEKVARLRHQLRNELAVARRKTDRGMVNTDQ
ncbi:MAG: transglycosylase SLT domain-containing protein [Gemmatimonadota bacterium]